MAKICTTHEHTSEGTEQYDFGFSDKKGRAIGAFCRQGVDVYTPAEPTDKSSPHYTWGIEAGTYLTAYIHSTRAGERFGASGRFKKFKIAGKDGEANASNTRSIWIATQIADMKAKQKASNAV